MTIGPVQLLVLGFDQPDFQGEVLAELQRLRDNDLVRVVDGLVVHKDADGNVSTLRHSQLDAAELSDFGAVVGALVGLGVEGPGGAEPGAEIGAEAVDEHGGVFDEDAWDVLAEIPDDSAAALVLLEHRWAIPLRDTIARAGGRRLASEFISPLDLVAIGLLAVEEAKELAAVGGDAI